MIDAMTFPDTGQSRSSLVGKHQRLHEMYLESLRREARAREYARREKQKRREGKLLLFSGFSVCHELFTAIMLLLQVVLVALKLDNRVAGPWGAVLIPVWILTFFFVLRPAVLQFIECFGVIDAEDRLATEEQDTSVILSYLPVHGIADDIENGHNKFMYWPMVIFTFLGIVLLGIKVTLAPSGLSWVAGFSMFAIVGIIGLIADLIWDEPIWTNDNYLDRIPPILPLIGFVVSCIVLGRRLDGGISLAVSWHCVLAPMYITLAALPVVSIIVAVLSECSFESHVDNDILWYIMAPVSLLFLTAPGTTFLGLLGSVLDGTIDLTFVQVFIPVIVLSTLLPVACVAWGFLRAFLLSLS